MVKHCSTSLQRSIRCSSTGNNQSSLHTQTHTQTPPLHLQQKQPPHTHKHIHTYTDIIIIAHLHPSTHTHTHTHTQSHVQHYSSYLFFQAARFLSQETSVKLYSICAVFLRERHSDPAAVQATGPITALSRRRVSAQHRR